MDINLEWIPSFRFGSIVVKASWLLDSVRHLKASTSKRTKNTDQFLGLLSNFSPTSLMTLHIPVVANQVYWKEWMNTHWIVWITEIPLAAADEFGSG